MTQQQSLLPYFHQQELAIQYAEDFLHCAQECFKEYLSRGYFVTRMSTEKQLQLFDICSSFDVTEDDIYRATKENAWQALRAFFRTLINELDQFVKKVHVDKSAISEFPLLISRLTSEANTCLYTKDEMSLVHQGS